MTVAAGLLMRIVDHDDFPTFGAGLWWAVQTVTTVGYGDRVPKNAAGELLAALVMLVGIGFVTVITASITSSFVERVRRQRGGGAESPATAEHLERVEARLERIEAALRTRS